MDIFIGIIALLAIFICIAYWRYILMGLSGALIFGLLGGFFGGSVVGSLGAIFGFIGGICAQRDEEKENLTPRSGKKNHTAKTSEIKSQKTNTINSQIVRCPTCNKKIRVRLPLQGEKGKCLACLNSFHILMYNEKVRLERIKTNRKPKSNKQFSSIEQCYHILDINHNSNPDEVKLAYKKKIQLYHPDRVAGLGEKLQKMANEESKLINTAYSMLKEKGLAK